MIEPQQPLHKTQTCPHCKRKQVVIQQPNTTMDHRCVFCSANFTVTLTPWGSTTKTLDAKTL